MGCPVQHLGTNSRSFASALVRGTDRIINTNIHIFDGGRRPEHPQKTHIGMGRTCRLHTERTWIRTQDPLTSKPPCCPQTCTEFHSRQESRTRGQVSHNECSIRVNKRENSQTNIQVSLLWWLKTQFLYMCYFGGEPLYRDVSCLPLYWN